MRAGGGVLEKYGEGDEEDNPDCDARGVLEGPADAAGAGGCGTKRRERKDDPYPLLLDLLLELNL